MSFWERFKFKKKPFKEAEERAALSPVKKTEIRGDERQATALTPLAAAGFSIEASRTLLRPYLSEKSARLAEHSVAVFEVDTRATAAEVARAVRAIYGVVPVKVRMVSLRGRAVRFGRVSGRTKKWKKAMVSLPAGKRIDFTK